MLILLVAQGLLGQYAIFLIFLSRTNSNSGSGYFSTGGREGIKLFYDDLLSLLPYILGCVRAAFKRESDKV